MAVNKNKQVRLDDETVDRVRELVRRSGLSESDVLRLALKAGLPLLESGEENPFASDFASVGKIHALDMPAKIAAEAPAVYQVKKHVDGSKNAPTSKPPKSPKKESA